MSGLPKLSHPRAGQHKKTKSVVRRLNIFIPVQNNFHLSPKGKKGLNCYLFFNMLKRRNTLGDVLNHPEHSREQ